MQFNGVRPVRIQPPCAADTFLSEGAGYVTDCSIPCATRHLSKEYRYHEH